MEELNDKMNADFIKGFNDGYLIAKNLPDLSKELVKSLGGSEQSKGFESGIRQCFLERVKIHERNWMKDDYTMTEKVITKDDKDIEKG